MSVKDDFDASRRCWLLRLLVEVNGSANSSVIYRAAMHAGVGCNTRDDIGADLDHLKRHGCITDEWLDEAVRVATITDRGEDAAYGRVEIPGVDRSRWNRKS